MSAIAPATPTAALASPPPPPPPPAPAAAPAAAPGPASGAPVAAAAAAAPAAAVAAAAAAAAPAAAPAAGAATGPAVTLAYGPGAVVAAKPILPTKRKAVGASGAERALGIARTREKMDAMGEDFQKFYDYSQNFALEMAEKYGHKQDYYLRLMFSGGASMQKAREPSAFNAWSHQLAKEYNEDGDSSKLLDLQREHLDEYHQLTHAEKRELVENFKEVRDSRKMGVRVNPRGRQADANHTFEKIEDLIVGLKCRIGVEGFYCFFKNNSEFQMRPRWYFTSPQLNRYFTGMIKKWDVENIGALGEAFSIAGCDLMSYLRNARSRADWLKNEIKEKITAGLVKITGNKKAVMQYKSYEKDIVLHYGIELVGWTSGLPFVCPSALPATIEPLQKLLQAIDTGECLFRRLDQAERAQRRRDYDAQVAAGSLPVRRTRKDKGKTRKPYRRRKAAARQDADEADDEDEGTARGKKRARKDDDFVESSSGSDAEE